MTFYFLTTFVDIYDYIIIVTTVCSSLKCFCRITIPTSVYLLALVLIKNFNNQQR